MPPTIRVPSGTTVNARNISAVADPLLSMVDVRDVAEAVFQTAVKTNLHGKNYLISNESYKVSDISLMLNRQPPVSGAVRTYSNALVKSDLGISFTSAKDTLNNL